MADFNQNPNNMNGASESFERFNSDGTKKKNKKDGKKGAGAGAAFVLIVVLAFIMLGNSMVVTRQNQFKIIRHFGRVHRFVTHTCLSFMIHFVDSMHSITK